MATLGGGRNLRLYPAYVICLNGFFWFPVFFLYFTSRVGLEGALFLEAIYYLAVVIFEIPSGWASDRFGRRFALRSSALFLTVSYLTFYLGDSVVELALAQILMAAGFAYNSGTDTAFHYDSLAAEGRSEEYGEREEKIAKLTFATVGITGLIGGVVGSIDLRLPYLLAAVLSAIGLVITMMLRPLPKGEEAERLDKQLLACARDLRNPLLAWLFGCSLLLTVVVHVPYQLYQPYLDLLDADLFPAETPTPFLTGLHAFGATMVGALLASHSVRWMRLFGLRVAVLGALGLGILLTIAIGMALHPIVAALLVLRSTPKALIQAPLNTLITPRIPASRRASYLSIQSLSGRLAFSMLLFTLSFAVTEQQTFAEIRHAAMLSGGVMVLAWIVLLLTSRAARPEGVGEVPESERSPSH